MSVLTDETGYHAEDCECQLCETGYRLSPEERRPARLAHQRAQAARARLLSPAPTSQREESAAHAAHRAAHAAFPEYTPEQLAELDELKRQRRNAK